jgi:hypothetical protein
MCLLSERNVNEIITHITIYVIPYEVKINSLSIIESLTTGQSIMPCNCVLSL